MRNARNIEMLKVKLAIGQYIFVGVVSLFFMMLALLLMVMALIEFNPLILVGAFLFLILMSSLPVMLIREHLKSVKYFTNEGLVRNDGKHFNWTDLYQVVFQIKQFANKRYMSLPQVGGGSLHRIEIQFRDGSTAWLTSMRVVNFDEVFRFIHSLPGEPVHKKNRW